MSKTQSIAKPRRGYIRRWYEWTMEHAKGPHAWKTLALVSFSESSFFPIPGDLFLIPMCLADRRRAFFLAGVCTLASVLGGIFGYVIGAWLYDSVGKWLIAIYGYGEQVEWFRAMYAKYGAWIILIKGLTPIPYKVVTIASGFSGYDLGAFIALSVLTRGARFYLVAGLIYVYGDRVRDFLEKRLELSLAVFLVVVVLGFLFARYVI
ncbi:MAG: YqaA family protein [Alphaproteobacteria bacterium]